MYQLQHHTNLLSYLAAIVSCQMPLRSQFTTGKFQGNPHIKQINLKNIQIKISLIIT